MDTIREENDRNSEGSVYMIAMKDINTMELKDLKNGLKLAKDKRMELIVELGELVHLQLLNQKLNHDELSEISLEIASQDRLIYRYGKQIKNINAASQQCSKCTQQLGGNAKFCGNCGTLNPTYIDPNTVYKACQSCSEEIHESALFCPCCGMKQGAL